ncbi:tyrosine--tRNA ligase [Kiritimatiella glycovorans]|uniref:Tyrosine--tRNA ligase n=1 Tax=Kiritimatiella glycovorans TaxID=1307763 RepID=A0A0G3EHW8_9BACT|nr:tyrosine--tRNA ligase [Kiritimatiella glycovorans]AKJ63779.1 Tyrosine--tRNA ligase [Kiritimatiella glycovorans]
MDECGRQLETLKARSVDCVTAGELERKVRRAAAEKRPLRIKYGADPSAPDIHLGHVVGLNKLREFQEFGHTVVFIIGDFTGMIGDPSGRSATRPALTREQVNANAKSYQQQVFKVLDPERTEVRFNSEWFGPMTFDDVVRLSAKVTVAQMLSRDDFAKRYSGNQPISLVEFLYPLIQAWDSVMVRADVELGGTDQIFNLLLGRELQKEEGQEPQVALTLPLLEGLDGVQKMSKSLGNYVGVTDAPAEMFGKLMSVSDELMWRYFSLILRRPEDELKKTRADVGEGRVHPRAVKDSLAREITAWFHSPEAAETAAQEFSRVFSRGDVPDDMPEHVLDAGAVGILDLITAAGLLPSKSEARRVVKQGGVRLNGERIDDPHARLEPEDGAVLKVGKRKFCRIRVGGVDE